jgi:hypothetical protein
MVDVGLEPFLWNVHIRDVAIHRRLGVYVCYLVARPQLERMGAADGLSVGSCISCVDESVPLWIDSVGRTVRTRRKITLGHDRGYAAQHCACPDVDYPDKPCRNPTASVARPLFPLMLRQG